jgi:hypothetical protein
MICIRLLISIAIILVATSWAANVEQVHLAQGKDPSSMMAMWVTADASNSECQFNAVSDTVVNKATGVSETYSFPGGYQSGHLHSALLTGLKPNTAYSYKCGDSSTGTWSTSFQFRTMPAVGDAMPVKWGILGDLGMTADSQTTVSHLQGSSVAGILHAGDLSYANCDQPKWDQYGNMVEYLAATTPWMHGPGNHEIEWTVGSTGKNVFKSFEARYKMPAVKPAEMGRITMFPTVSCTPSQFQSEYNYGNSFYSFEAGLTHVTYLNCYSTSDEQSAQYAFAKSDFSSVDRSKTPWLVVVMHCPWYNSNTAHVDEVQTVAMKASMEQLMYTYGVNIAFQGHVHAYERSYPVYNGVRDAKGTTYINIGDAGNAEGHASTYESPAPVWSAFRDGTQYGHGVFTVLNSTVASWEWNRNVDGVKVSSDFVYLQHNGR